MEIGRCSKVRDIWIRESGWMGLEKARIYPTQHEQSGMQRGRMVLEASVPAA